MCNTRYPHLISTFSTRAAAYAHFRANGFLPSVPNLSLWQRVVWPDNTRRTQNATIVKDGKLYRTDVCLPY